ncbi:MAG TPA: hypothetical protein VH475_13405 [Tepidisphaeraceae bacterium]|jgi:hypothetical protein
MNKVKVQGKHRPRRPINPSDCDVEFIAKACLADPGPSEYMTSVEGRIVVEMPPPPDPDDPDDDPTTAPLVRHQAGRVSLSVYDLTRAERDRHSFFEVFDCVDQAAFEIFRQLFTERGNFRPELDDVVDRHEVDYPSLLVIESIELLPRFRGCGLGLAVVLKAMHLFGPLGGLAAIIPAPLSRPFDRESGGKGQDREQWRRRMRLDAFAEQDPGKACAKLAAYWSRLGFEQVVTVEGSWLYARGLGVPLPKVEDLIKQGEGEAGE